MIARYLLDARPAMSRSTGVGNYVLGLVGGLSRLIGAKRSDSKAAGGPSENEELVLFSSSWKGLPGPLLRDLGARENVHTEHRRVPVRVLNYLWHHTQLPKIESLAGDLAVAHSPHPLLIPASRAAQVVTVHDLYFLEQQDHTFREVRRDYPRLLWRSLDQADAILCVSKATLEDLLRKAEAAGKDPSELARKSTVTPNGVDSEFFSSRAAGSESRRESDTTTPRPFLLAVGRIEPRKNPHRILEAFAKIASEGEGRMATEVDLVWAGMPANEAMNSEFQTAVRELGLHERVRVLGYIEKQHLRQLYQDAVGLVFPSVHEGFGLPILEAMASGCPVLTSNATAMPEVAGNCAVLVDPLSTEAIAQGMLNLLAKTEHPETLRDLVDRAKTHASSFSWEATAAATLAVYRSVSLRKRGHDGTAKQTERTGESR